MKKLLSLLLIGIVACMAWSCSSDDDPEDVIISVNDLPKDAQTFLDTYFTNSTIVKVEKDVDNANTGAFYEVTFKDGGEVDFDVTGNWVSVEAPAGGQVLDELIPEPIKTYVTANYGGLRIMEISKELGGYWEVGLSSGVDLYFDGDYNFVRADN